MGKGASDKKLKILYIKYEGTKQCVTDITPYNIVFCNSDFKDDLSGKRY